MSHQAVHESSSATHESGDQRVDMHCHCLPGIDDGPATLEDALSLCRLLVADGITTVVATPHQLGRYGRANTARRISDVLNTFRGDLARHEIPLTILPGAEVRIDENILSGIDSGELLTLAGSRTHLLLELPKHTFIDPAAIIQQFSTIGRQVIIAHPERQHRVMQLPEIAGPWVTGGAILQVTAGSLLGDFGEDSERAAWKLLEKGWVELIASDAHSANKRPPRMTAAMDAITDRLGEAVAKRICITNPARIARGTQLITGRTGKSAIARKKTPTPAISLQAWAQEMEQAAGSGSDRLSLASLCRWFSGSVSHDVRIPKQAPRTLE
jgi:protein-tyrosine phosphatase